MNNERGPGNFSQKPEVEKREGGTSIEDLKLMAFFYFDKVGEQLRDPKKSQLEKESLEKRSDELSGILEFLRLSDLDPSHNPSGYRWMEARTADEALLEIDRKIAEQEHYELSEAYTEADKVGSLRALASLRRFIEERQDNNLPSNYLKERDNLRKELADWDKRSYQEGQQ